MAYKQSPGRGNNPKTGYGLPSPLKQEEITDGKIDVKTKQHTGYDPVTSSLPNTVNKGGYEKSLDKSGNTLYLRGGDKKVLASARLGSSQADEITRSYNAKKNDTEFRRKTNLEFLEPKVKTGSIVK